MRVVVAVCRNSQGEVLLAQRAAHAHLGGTWEFPGGKVEPGETDADALVRELREELGLVLEAGARASALLTRSFSYPDRTLTIQAYELVLTPEQCASLHGAEGQALRWLSAEAISSVATPPANAPLIAALRWPAYWHISPPTTDADAVLAWLAARCQRFGHGSHGLVLRLPGWPLADYVALAQQALSVTAAAGLPVLLHGDVRVCSAVAAFGFHASAMQALHWQQQGLRKCDVLPTGYHLAVASHSAEELACAEAVMADWAWLSPVLATPSHPRAAGLGWPAWAALVQNTSLPVYALGGMDATLLPTARAQGGVGIAGISGF